MTKPRSIKVDASDKCEICGGEPYAMVRRPKLTMNVSEPASHHKSSLLCQEHFQRFKDEDLNLSNNNYRIHWIIYGIALVSIAGLFYFLMNNS